MAVFYPSRECLLAAVWEFSHVGGPTAATAFRLEQDGTIHGYQHFNETAWRLEDGVLALVTAEGRTSSRFDRVERLDDGAWVLTGRFLLEPQSPIELELRQHARQVPISAGRLTGSTWLMWLGSQAYPGEIQFDADGTVGGSKHDSVRRWTMVDEVLELGDDGSRPFVRIDRVTTASGGLRLRGACLDAAAGTHLELREYRRLGDEAILGSFTTERPGGNSRETLAEWIRNCGWSVGEHSYGTPIVFEPTMAKLTIGRFTSIAAYVSIALGNHSMATGTTYPFSSMPSIWPSAPPLADHETKGDVTIGNDVWIGSFAFIASGVTIGDGAVIGAHTTVTRNVPPYAIVAGNPGRIIRYRFEPEMIEDLLRIAWWNWDDRKIAVQLPVLMKGDMQAFVAQCRPTEAGAGA
jgi:acetyltransferase-like isoleucine patch superfamily enzyme